MRFLFHNKALNWPLRSGNNVHVFNVVRELLKLDVDVTLHTTSPVDQEILDLLPGLEWLTTTENGITHPPTPPSLVRRRFEKYWGLPKELPFSIAKLVRETKSDAVVVCGVDGLPLLQHCEDVARVWYVADSPLLHHWSLLTGPREVRRRLRPMLSTWMYERAFRRFVDVGWVVSQRDAKWLQRSAGIRHCAVLPNGVDFDMFRPADLEKCSPSCVFWGRLDFPPNEEAIAWFLTKVWPEVRRRVPKALFTVIGASATQRVETMCIDHAGVRLLKDVPDLRATVPAHNIAVFPFFSGGGIKNKLLEGAAMGMPIVASPLACNGLIFDDGRPFPVPKTPAEWADAIVRLLEDMELRDSVSQECRRWVMENHSWSNTAKNALKSILAENAVGC